MSLNELAARVEALQGPCRKTDAAIFRAIDAPLPAEFAGKKIALTFDEARSAFFMEMGDMVVRYEPPKYTASIDAAMTLVPEGCEWMLETDYQRRGDPITANINWLDVDGIEHSWATGHSPALALCAASLRALSALGQSRSSMGGER